MDLSAPSVACGGGATTGKAGEVVSLRRVFFPFTAIVGLEKAKLALLAVSVDPTIGGVLLAGDKGTGKSTLVRALAQVLPEVPVVKGCPFNCNPLNPAEMCDEHYRAWLRGMKLEIEYRPMRVIDLPLSVTPDRLVGSVDVERTIKEGRIVFKPGLLAEANRNILYIDEVNLLEDYIADLLLDAAASGWNIVEREGISFKHPARFILVGTMNPEEGELRPQLLDRFGLYVRVEASRDPEVRAEIVRRVEEFHRDPIGFRRRWEGEQRRIREGIVKAKELLPEVSVDDDLLRLLTRTTVEMGIRTHRAEITTIKAAKAIAALNGRTKVTFEDLKKAMELTLPHRLKSRPFETPPPPRAPPKERKGEGEPREGGRDLKEGKDERGGGGGSKGGKHASLLFKPVKPEGEVGGREASGRFAATLLKPRSMGRGSRAGLMTFVGGGRGYAVTYALPRGEELSDVDLVATLNAAALRTRSLPLKVEEQDVRVKLRRCRVPRLVVLLLDCSGSMSLRRRMSLAKGLALKLIEESYVRRDYVALITFRGRRADVMVPPTRKYESVYEIIDKLPTGGRTPLSAALSKLLMVAGLFRLKYRDSVVKAILITDGKANVPLTNAPVKEELMGLASSIRRRGIRVEIYDTRPKGVIDPSPSYLGVLAEALGSDVRVV